MLDYFKSQFHKNELIHLNNAGLQPITKAAHEKVSTLAKRFWEEGYFAEKDFIADIMYARESLANMIGCLSTEVAFFTSTAGAVNQVCSLTVNAEKYCPNLRLRLKSVSFIPDKKLWG